MRRVLVASLALMCLTLAAGAAPAANNVALFSNPTYVDTGPPPNGEQTNLLDTLTAQGFTVSTFTGITASAINAALVGQQVLMFPEFEVRPLSPDLSLEANFTIGNFVANQGGTLIVCNEADGDPLALINNAFSVDHLPPNQVFQLTAITAVPPFNKTAAANDSPFSGGPPSLPANNIVSAVLKASIPPSGKIIYADANGNGIVVWIPPDGSSVTGGGHVVILGWDWFDAATQANPGGQPSGEWNSILRTAASLTGVPTIPTLSEWAMMAMAGILLLIGLGTLKRGRLTPA